MRAKIIWVFAIVVTVVGGLAFAVMGATLGDVVNREDAPRAVTAAVTHLEVEGLRIERWLATQAGGENAQEPFLAGTPGARSKTATDFADAVNEAFKRDSVAAISPALVVIVDAKGVVVGRNGSELMRGQKLGERHSTMMEVIKSGRTGSDVWVSQDHNEQLLASYAPIRDAQGALLGGIAVGTPFSDERLAQTVGKTGSMLVAAVPKGDKFEVLAKSNGVTAELGEALQSENAIRAMRQAQDAAGVVDLAGLPKDFFGSARRLSGFGDSKRAVIMAVTKARIVGGWGTLIWPALGVIVLGLILTVVCGYMLDNYISRPISDLEEGLLAIINGQRDIRFELEHAVLGGLVFRVNSLLNELLGIQEDTTDAEGRASLAPSSQRLAEAIDVNERVGTEGTSPAGTDAHALSAEPADAYYQRMFAEYKAAKQSLGDPVDHVTLASFTERLQTSEREMQAKHNRPYRFRIEVEGKEVVLVPVALG